MNVITTRKHCNIYGSPTAREIQDFSCHLVTAERPSGLQDGQRADQRDWLGLGLAEKRPGAAVTRKASGWRVVDNRPAQKGRWCE